MNEIGLYIHIPFCKQKCYYCDFISFSDKQEFIENTVEWFFSGNWVEYEERDGEVFFLITE